MPLSLTKVFNPRPGWYRGDFHAHTNFSDGALTPPQLVAIAKAEGLDFFAITDHNAIGAYPNFGDPDGLLIIPGIEVTYKKGHYNVFGIAEEADWLQQVCAGYVAAPADSDLYPTINLLMQATAQSARLNSINHPLLAPWAWEFPDTDLGQVHCLEIWNDPSWPDNRRDNPRALGLWTEWLNAGYRITAIGGSDYHRPVPPPHPPKLPDRLGLPSTYVYARELSGRAILEALRERRAYVSMGPRAAFQVRINSTTYDIGADLGELTGELEFTATVADCLPPARAYLIKNGQPLVETIVENGGASLRCTDRAEATEPAWYRLDVLDSDGLMLAVTNPIFAGPQLTPEQRRFGDFVG
jgi:hypothetical protein